MRPDPFEGGKAQHGTYAGYQRHIKVQQQPCADCRKAVATYQRERRKNPVVLQQHRDQVKARDLALKALTKSHPEEYQELQKEFLAEILEERTREG